MDNDHSGINGMNRFVKYSSVLSLFLSVSAQSALLDMHISGQNGNGSATITAHLVVDGNTSISVDEPDYAQYGTAHHLADNNSPVIHSRFTIDWVDRSLVIQSIRPIDNKTPESNAVVSISNNRPAYTEGSPPFDSFSIYYSDSAFDVDPTVVSEPISQTIANIDFEYVIALSTFHIGINGGSDVLEGREIPSSDISLDNAEFAAIIMDTQYLIIDPETNEYLSPILNQFVFRITDFSITPQPVPLPPGILLLGSSLFGLLLHNKNRLSE